MYRFLPDILEKRNGCVSCFPEEKFPINRQVAEPRYGDESFIGRKGNLGYYEVGS
jgi:hypothetical protein